jgi:DNA polymerase-3 subunit delta
MNHFVELMNSLKRGVVAPVYLFYGEETYLQEQAVFRFRQHFVSDGENAADLNYDLIDGEDAEPAYVAARAEMYPFAAGKRLVVVRRPAFFKPSKRPAGETAEKKGRKQVPAGEALLLEYINNPLTSTCLIFTTDKPVDKRRRLFQAIKKNGRVLEFNRLGRGEAVRWLGQKAGVAGRRFDAGAAEALLDAAGPHLQRLVAEMEKVLNYTAGQQIIAVADVRAVCSTRPEENIFAVVDAVGNRRYGEALEGIKDLLAAREPAPRILALLSRQFRLLLQVNDLLGRGLTAGEITARLKIHPYIYKKIALQCQNFDQAALVNAVQALSELDLAVKTGRQEFYPAVETFLLSV